MKTRFKRVKQNMLHGRSRKNKAIRRRFTERLRVTERIRLVLEALLELKESFGKEHTEFVQRVSRRRADEEALKLHGALIEKAFAGHDGLFRGHVEDMGWKQRPYRFRITYEDGDSETMCVSEVKALCLVNN